MTTLPALTGGRCDAAPILARERGADYLAGPDSDSPRDRDDQRDGGQDGGADPFGLPILGELPELASMLQAVHKADRSLLAAVLTLVELRASDEVLEASGIDLDHWLAATVRATRLDRSMLRRAARLLERFPALHRAAVDGAISFAQLRALTLRLSDAPVAADEALDRWLGAAIDQLPADADPDILVKHAARALDELRPELLAEQEDLVARYERSLTIQPDLFGTGGTYHGTEDALGLAILEAATARRPEQRHLSVGRARANNLQTLLRDVAGAGDDAEAVGHDGGSAGEDGRAANDSVGVADTDGDGVHDGEPFDGPLPLGQLPPPRLLLRCELSTLLGRDALPVDLLTRLVGGRLLATSGLARTLIDERGAEIRTVIVDQGEVLGVGTATRVPPGWLRETLLALHDTCTAPTCDRSAVGADVDHAVTWTPTGDQAARGPTDLINLGPLCPSTNVDKERAGWRVTQTSVGQRRWVHPRSGVTITSIPATWRPRGLPPPRARPPCRQAEVADQPGGGYEPSERAAPPDDQADRNGTLPF